MDILKYIKGGVRQENERVKGTEGGNANGKASSFCQLAKYPDDLTVAIAITPSLAVSVS